MEALFTVIARSMGIEALQVEAVMTLLREGSSVPFIARYRKERTKGLDEEQIRQIEEAYQYQTHLEKRKEDVLRLIDQQGMLDEALREAICACEKLSQVEDLYRPYQQKRTPKDCDRWRSGCCGCRRRAICEGRQLHLSANR